MAAAVGTHVRGIDRMLRPEALKTLAISRTALTPATDRELDDALVQPKRLTGGWATTTYVSK